jgi:hypothetical protein
MCTVQQNKQSKTQNTRERERESARALLTTGLLKWIDAENGVDDFASSTKGYFRYIQLMFGHLQQLVAVEFLLQKNISMLLLDAGQLGCPIPYLLRRPLCDLGSSDHFDRLRR